MRIEMGMPLSEFVELSWRHFFYAYECYKYDKWESMHKVRLIMWSNIMPNTKKKIKPEDLLTIAGDETFYKNKQVTKEEKEQLINKVYELRRGNS